ncbi:hypothetical protein B484DRAFT_442952 [Ochromonadaceae sp. CCMP2298]|nr:hypothetical protein B484DRAFT_442952 [Ochromonadaceae sp. CCMP2298]
MARTKQKNGNKVVKVPKEAKAVAAVAEVAVPVSATAAVVKSEQPDAKKSKGAKRKHVEVAVTPVPVVLAVTTGAAAKKSKGDRKKPAVAAVTGAAMVAVAPATAVASQSKGDGQKPVKVTTVVGVAAVAPVVAAVVAPGTAAAVKSPHPDKADKSKRSHQRKKVVKASKAAKAAKAAKVGAGTGVLGLESPMPKASPYRRSFEYAVKEAAGKMKLQRRVDTSRTAGPTPVSSTVTNSAYLEKQDVRYNTSLLHAFNNCIGLKALKDRHFRSAWQELADGAVQAGVPVDLGTKKGNWKMEVLKHVIYNRFSGVQLSNLSLIVAPERMESTVRTCAAQYNLLLEMRPARETDTTAPAPVDPTSAPAPACPSGDSAPVRHFVAVRNGTVYDSLSAAPVEMAAWGFWERVVRGFRVRTDMADVEAEGDVGISVVSPKRKSFAKAVSAQPVKVQAPAAPAQAKAPEGGSKKNKGKSVKVEKSAKHSKFTAPKSTSKSTTSASPAPAAKTAPAATAVPAATVPAPVVSALAVVLSGVEKPHRKSRKARAKSAGSKEIVSAPVSAPIPASAPVPITAPAKKAKKSKRETVSA